MAALPKKPLSEQPRLAVLPAGTVFPVLLTPQAETDRTKRNPTATKEAVADLLGINRGPNAAPGAAFHVVRYARNAHPLRRAGESTLDTLLAGDAIGLGHHVHIVDPLPGEPREVVLLYKEGPLNCWLDGDRVQRSSGAFYALDSPEALAVNVPAYDPNFNADGTPAGYPVNYVVRYAPQGGTEAFYAADVPNPSAAPGAVAGQWHQVDPPRPAYLGVATITEANFLLAYADNQFSAFSGKDLLVNERAGGAGNLTIPVNALGSPSYDDAYLADAQNPDAPAAPVAVAVVNGAVVTRARQGRAVFYFFAGTPDENPPPPAQPIPGTIQPVEPGEFFYQGGILAKWTGVATDLQVFEPLTDARWEIIAGGGIGGGPVRDIYAVPQSVRDAVRHPGNTWSYGDLLDFNDAPRQNVGAPPAEAGQDGSVLVGTGDVAAGDTFDAFEMNSSTVAWRYAYARRNNGTSGWTRLAKTA